MNPFEKMLQKVQQTGNAAKSGFVKFGKSLRTQAKPNQTAGNAFADVMGNTSVKNAKLKEIEELTK